MEKISERNRDKQQIIYEIFKYAYSELLDNENRNITINFESISIQKKDLIIDVLHELEETRYILNLIIGQNSSISFSFFPLDLLYLEYEMQTGLRTLHNEYKLILEEISDHTEFIFIKEEDIKRRGSELPLKQIELLIDSIFHIVDLTESHDNHSIPYGIRSITPFGENLLKQLENEKNLIQNPEFLNTISSSLEDHSFKIHNYSTFKDGHIGWVFKGFNLIDERYAIKIYKKPMDIENKNKYLREPTSLMKLNHPNIVKYKNHFLLPFNNQKYLVIIEEFINGKTLQDTISLLSEQDSSIKINFIIKTLEVLSHFKSTLNLHGDLTFTNIMVRENFQPVIIDPGFSEQRFKSHDQIIKDEKLFIVDLVIKLLTSSEKESIDLDSLMKFDSLSEFQTFFQNAEKKINNHQKQSIIQLELNQVKKFSSYMVNVFSFRYSMKKFHEISELFHPNQYKQKQEPEIFQEISLIHEKIVNMKKVMNHSTNKELEKIENDKNLDWLIINRHFDYTSFEDLNSDYRDVYSKGFKTVKQKLLDVAVLLKERIDHNIFEKYFRNQLEEFQKHNNFKLIALPFIRNSFSDRIFQLSHKYYIGTKIHQEINSITCNSRSPNEIELTLQYQCENPKTNKNSTISVFLPNHLEFVDKNSNYLSTNINLNYEPKFKKILDLSIKRFYRAEKIPLIIKTEINSSIIYQILMIKLKFLNISVNVKKK